jgi:hypothetical protein
MHIRRQKIQRNFSGFGVLFNLFYITYKLFSTKNRNNSINNSSTSGMNSKNNNSHNTSPKQTEGLMWILSLGKRMGFAVVFVEKGTTVTSNQ